MQIDFQKRLQISICRAIYIEFDAIFQKLRESQFCFSPKLGKLIVS